MARRATPVLSDKLSLIFQAMQRALDSDLAPGQRFAILRNRAILAVALRSLKRGAELMSTRTADIISFPQCDGLIFNYTFGKTLRDGSSHMFGIRRDDVRPDLCAVAHLRAYVDGARALGIDLARPGPGALLFRPWLSSAEATEASADPFSVSDLTPMLRSWLRFLGIDGGETFHGLRSGGAIEMALTGAPLLEIMARGYWTAPPMAQHYMGMAQTLMGGGPLPALAPTGALAPDAAVTAQWRDANEMRGFFRAFLADRRAGLP